MAEDVGHFTNGPIPWPRGKTTSQTARRQPSVGAEEDALLGTMPRAPPNRRPYRRQGARVSHDIWICVECERVAVRPARRKAQRGRRSRASHSPRSAGRSAQFL